MLNPTLQLLNNNDSNKNQNRGKYKTTLCKHFSTPQGCSYGFKCQFAHGTNELRSNNTSFAPIIKNQNNMLNYKVAKCKNWEKNGTCKYGILCTFAHGDKEIRNKNENLYQIGAFPIMMPFNYDINSMGMMMPTNINLNPMPQLIPEALNQNKIILSNETKLINDENNQRNEVINVGSNN